jgi:hypothetical protein
MKHLFIVTPGGLNGNFGKLSDALTTVFEYVADNKVEDYRTCVFGPFIGDESAPEILSLVSSLKDVDFLMDIKDFDLLKLRKQSESFMNFVKGVAGISDDIKYRQETMDAYITWVASLAPVKEYEGVIVTTGSAPKDASMKSLVGSFFTKWVERKHCSHAVDSKPCLGGDLEFYSSSKDFMQDIIVVDRDTGQVVKGLKIQTD